MPLYEYECKACGRFSASRPMAEFDLPAPCPDCGQQAMRALTTPTLIGDTGRRGSRSGEHYVRLRHSSRCRCCP